MANNFVDRGHEVTIITFKNPESDFYKLRPAIRRVALARSDNSRSGIRTKIARNLDWMRTLRNHLKEQRPGIVISFMNTANILILLAACGLQIPVIATEHTNPKAYPLGFHWRVLRRLTYPFASSLVSVSKGMNESFSWLPLSRRNVIVNALAPEFEDLPIPVNSNRKTQIVSMGRLHWEKGFDQLLSAFAKIVRQHPDWTLLILGEGGERQKLDEQIKALGIGESVKMPGAVNNVIPFLQESSVFVLSSRYEGFGNVIIEAMASGLPVVSFSCDYGPSEIIAEGEDGVLVPAGDVDALARAIEQLIQNEAERKRLAENAQKSARRFYIDNIMDQWEALIQDRRAVATHAPAEARQI